MTNIISGENISGSLTTNNPQIVDPTSPFNGQFYDDFDLGSVNVIDPSNTPFLLAASQELGGIGSVQIGETRSTNIFIQPPTGSVPGASTIIQLINTTTNSVDAQATSSSSEPLNFVKNAEIVGTDYKIRVINATPGDYQISLAGAIQAVQVVGTTGTNPVEGVALIDPTIARDSIDGLIYDSTGGVIGAARRNPDSPTVGLDSSVSIDPPTDAPPIPTLPEGDITSEQIPIVFKDNELIPTPFENVSPPVSMTAVPTDTGSLTDPAFTGMIDNFVFNNVTTSSETISDKAIPGTAPEIDPALVGIDPVIFQNAVGPLPEIAFTSPAPFFTRSDNFLKISNSSGFGISAISQKPGSKVNEIGIFVVDDATGKVNGIAPGAAGYLKAVTNSARSIFSTLGGNFFDSSSKREIFLEPNTYGFFEVQDGSIADLKQQLANGQTPTNVLFSTPGANGVIPIQLTNSDTYYNLSVNKDELVLDVTFLNGVTPTAVIGAKSQGLAEGRTIDLTDLTGTLKADIETKSSAAYTNNIGFYAVEDSIGTIKLANGETRKPGDADYAVEAIKSALANSGLQAGKTDRKLGQDITGGRIYAPVVVSQGSLSDFITANPKNIGGGSNNAYFNYVLGNSDKQDHFRLIGDNTFGVEDQLGGGDRDFNDLVVNVNVKVNVPLA
jgi:Domain of unknown function (DUF4114)